MHHELAWRIITDLIPEIKTSKFIAVSDDEFTCLLEKNVKKGLALVAKCEIHAVKKIERWVSTHGGSKATGQVLKSDFRCVNIHYNKGLCKYYSVFSKHIFYRHSNKFGSQTFIWKMCTFWTETGILSLNNLGENNA